MTETQYSSPIRGAIRVTVSTSTDNLVAGEEFSIFVTVQNPFEVPITLHRVSTYLPTEFLDLDQRLRELQTKALLEELAEIQEEADKYGISASFIPKPRSSWEKLFQRMRLSIPFFGFEIGFEPRASIGPAVARDVSTVELSLPFGLGKQTYTQTINDEQKENERKGYLERVINKYERAIDSIQSREESVKPLQPGNSTIRVFTVKSRKVVQFNPSTYKLNIELDYEIDSTRNLDTIEHTIHVRASLTSIILGALIGGMAGWFTSKGMSSLTLNIASLASLAGSLLFAAMAVVLFARKKDIQPFIAVEDFWGGIAIGFIVAYSGPKLFESLIRTEGNSS